MGSMEKCLRDSGLNKRNVHDVVLVGGSAMISLREEVDPRILQWEGTQQIRQF